MSFPPFGALASDGTAFQQQQQQIQQQQQQLESQVDMQKLTALKQNLMKIKDLRAKTKAEYDEIEQTAVNLLLSLNVRYVDVSGKGAGPYWVLSKESTNGTFNKERFNEFFSRILQEIRSNPNVSAEQCSTYAAEFLKQFEKRRLVLNQVSTCRVKGVDDLKRWLNHIDTPNQ